MELGLDSAKLEWLKNEAVESAGLGRASGTAMKWKSETRPRSWATVMPGKWISFSSRNWQRACRRPGESVGPSMLAMMAATRLVRLRSGSKTAWRSGITRSRPSHARASSQCWGSSLLVWRKHLRLIFKEREEY